MHHLLWVLAVVPLAMAGFNSINVQAAAAPIDCDLPDSGIIDMPEDPCPEELPDTRIVAVLVAAIEAATDGAVEGAVADVNQIIATAGDLADVCEADNQRAAATDCAAIVTDAIAQVEAILDDYLAQVNECTGSATDQSRVSSSATGSEAAIDCNQVKALAAEAVALVLATIAPVVADATDCIGAAGANFATASQRANARYVDCAEYLGTVNDVAAELSAWTVAVALGLVAYAQACAEGNAGTYEVTLPSSIGTDGSQANVCAMLWDTIEPINALLADLAATVDECSSGALPAVNAGQRNANGESLVECQALIEEVMDTLNGLLVFAEECVSEALGYDAELPASGSKAELAADCQTIIALANQVVALLLSLVQPVIDDVMDCEAAIAGTYDDRDGTLTCQEIKQTVLDLVDEWSAWAGQFADETLDYLEACTAGEDATLPAMPPSVNAPGEDDSTCSVIWNAAHPAFDALANVVATAADCTGNNGLEEALLTQPDGEPLLDCQEAISDLVETVAGIAGFVSQCLSDATGLSPAVIMSEYANAQYILEPSCEDFGQPRSATILEPCNLADNDGDGIYRADICSTTYTIDPKSPETDASQGGQTAVTIHSNGIGDPDDTDPTNPIPSLDIASIRTDVGPCPDDASAVCYHIGACYTHEGYQRCEYETGRISSNLLPLDLPAMPQGASLGPDNDQDGVPVSMEIERATITVHADGTYTSQPAKGQFIIIDGDDGNRNDPLPLATAEELVQLAEGVIDLTSECAGRAASSYQSCLELICESHYNGNPVCDVYEELTPKACFEFSPEFGNTGTPVMFDASCSEDSLDAASSLEYRWDWTDDGTWDTSYSTNPVSSHAFSKSGYETVRLEVRNAVDLTGAESQTVLIDDPPVACAGGPTQVISGEEAFFNVQCSTDDLTATRRLNVAWDWNNDGAWDEYTGGATWVGHMFIGHGPRTIRVAVADERQQQDETTVDFNIASRPQAALSVTPAEADVGDVFTFSAAQTTDGYWSTADLQLDYDLNGDGTFELINAGFGTKTQTYTSAGNAYARLRVTNPDGIQDTTTATFFVDDAPSIDGIPDGPEFGATSLALSYAVNVKDPGNDAVTVTFDWGDGQTGSTSVSASRYTWTNAATSHEYAMPGVYCIKAQARDEDGNTLPWTNCFTVTIQKPTETPFQPIGLEHQYRSTATSFSTVAIDPDGDDLRYTLNWGDGQTTQTAWIASGTEVSLSHSWTAQGEFCVKAKAEDRNGIESAWSSCHTIEIHRPTTTCFQESVDTMVVEFRSGCSSGDITKFEWDFGDGATSMQANPTNTYAFRSAAVGGSYKVTLTTTDPVGTKTFTRNVAVGINDHDLALWWAPIFYQDTDSDDPSADMITKFDFDGDWKGNNNWENEPHKPHFAHVYYSVHETDKHYYLSYMVFHPRDWSESDFGEHENDMEGALVMILKDPNEEKGHFQALITMAHNFYYSYTNPYADASRGLTRVHAGGWANEGGSVDLYFGHNPELQIEAHGHGINSARAGAQGGSALDPYDHRSGRFAGDFGIKYFPGTIAEEPVGGSDPHVTYSLLPLDEIWDRRYEADSPETWESYGVFEGGDNGSCGNSSPWDFNGQCKEDAARAPWAMYNAEHDGNEYYGTWFEHPSRLMDGFFDGTDHDEAYGYRSTGEIMETMHNYDDGDDYAYTWTIPGANVIKQDIPRIELGAGDYLEILDGEGKSAVKFGNTGGITFAVWNHATAGDRFTLKFTTTDNDASAWGFRARGAVPV